jgi:PAS domain S-box-containing protein
MYKILVLDDSKTMNNVIYSVFRDDFESYRAYCIKDAKKILNEVDIDYIMLDINLPDGNGYDLVEELQDRSIKIFVLTTEDDKQFIEMNYQKGIIEYVIKDKLFLHKLKSIPKTIQRLEKNREKNILVVDDSTFIRKQLKRLFENRYYNVIAVGDTKSALVELKKQSIDLIMLDIELHDENGIDFLSKNKAFIVEESQIPVMIVSGYIDEMVTKLAIKAGAVDVLKKPYVTEEIIFKVDSWIDYNSLNSEMTNLKEEYQSITKAKEGFEILLDATMEMIFIHDKELNIIDINKTAYESCGYDEKERLLSRNLKEFVSDSYRDIFLSHLDNEDKYEIEIKNVDGEILVVLTKTKQILINMEYVYITTMLDITNLKQKESQLLHQSKLAQMGEMIGMIAHQWRQPLATVGSYSEAMRLKARIGRLDSEQIIDISKNISKQVHYLSATIDDFRNFFKQDKELHQTTLNSTISSVLDILDMSLKNNGIDCRLKLDSEVRFYTFENELKQVIINLIKNAEDVLLENMVNDPYIMIQSYDDGENVVLKIEDNGGGIEQNIIERIFEPYFSTKIERNGTGLGLYMSKTIIEKHCKGELSVKNKNNGAEFSIILKKDINK